MAITEMQASRTPLVFRAAALDSYATRITTGLAYLGGLLMLPLFFAYLANLRWSGLIVPVALALALAVFLLLSYAAQPTEYVVEAAQLRVRRRWLRALKLPLGELGAVSAAPTLAEVPRRGLRFAFNAGVFGYQGPFRLDPYGEVFFLATNRERLVAIARPGTTALIVSPERPRAFTEALNEARAQYALDQLSAGATGEEKSRSSG
jgi:hypothetical protein